MPSSTSDNLRLKQPCATIIERLDKEKVTFGVLDSCGRITDACFEMWTRKFRGIQVLIFKTTRLKSFASNFPRSCLF